MRNSAHRAAGLRQRTKQFALRVRRLYSAVRGDDAANVIGRQMLRSGTSVGAQYCEACRARTSAEFASKIESASQELDETGYWLELLVESGLVPQQRLEGLLQEVNELLAIFVAPARPAKGDGPK